MAAMSNLVARLLLVVIVVALAHSAGAPRVLAAPAAAAPDTEDYRIPNGHFFPQAAPGQNGAGYRVANEAGIPFWDAFEETGGLEELGYPLTRRFIWKGDVVQLFQKGALRWRPKEGRADVVRPRDIGTPPDAAKVAEPPLRSSGDAERYPWSGWWWPANDIVGGPRLFDANGPLAKYDLFVQSLGRGDPDTAGWERSEIRFSRLQWAGHCNGWAAAALLEPEPQEPREINGIHFSVADLKGLLTSYHFANAAAWAVGGDDADVSPAEFHKVLTSWLGGNRKGAVFTFRLGEEEVWSYPAFKYETIVGPDPVEADLWHVRTVVWLVDNDVPAGYVGAIPWPSPDGKVFEYTLRGDPNDPRGGEWSAANQGRFGRPYMVWYPDPNRRNIDRHLASPALEYGLLRQILGRADDGPVFTPPRPRR
ncbi:MAG: hypothetical protein M3O34_10520 [Chloroflexota bacterium]|nr:hypothetical protein [Chloroflexota bacterium]